jgi:hypothetical protein
MTFSTLNLTGERVLVKGTDSQGTEGSVVLDSSEWSEVKRHESFASAEQSFDATVEKFFAPLMAAADKFESAMAKPKLDPISYVTIHEGTEAVDGRDEVTIKLSPDSIVLRIIESGDTDRLVWVNERLEVLEVLDYEEPTYDGGTPKDTDLPADVDDTITDEGWTATPVDEV